MSDHAASLQVPRWIPIVTATLAVLASVSGWQSHDRVIASDHAKADAIIATTVAGHVLNEYESSRIRTEVRHAGAADTGAEAVLLAKAHGLEADAEHDAERSERLLASHEGLELGTTLFEIAIVLASVDAISTSRLLTIATAALGSCGAIAALVGFFS
jgi:hypothetical protein